MSIDWPELVNSGKLKICTPLQAQARGMYPNRLGWPEDWPEIRAAAAVVFQSKVDFALSESSLNFIVNAKKNGKITENQVLFGRNGAANGQSKSRDAILKPPEFKLLAARSVEEVAALVSNRPPVDGKFGPYWWIEAAELIDPDLVPL